MKEASHTTKKHVQELAAISRAVNPYQTEFPIADDRQHERFEAVIAMVESLSIKGTPAHCKDIQGAISLYIEELERYIDRLNAFTTGQSLVPITLESHPISYSVMVFNLQLSKLHQIQEYLNNRYTNNQ